MAVVTKKHLSNPPKIFDGLSVESKIIRALQTIAQKWPVPGSSLDLGNSDWPLFCDSGADECGWIFKTLFARSYIADKCEINLAGEFWLTGPLTAKAWAELEAAKTKYQQHNLCFVAMRFVKELDPLFEAMRRACNRAG